MDTNDEAIRRAAAIWAQHGVFIRAMIRYHTANKLEVEDLCQEFFFALIRKPVPLDVRNMEGYLYQATAHHVVDAIRHEKAYAQNVKKYAEEVRFLVYNRESGNALLNDELRTAVVRWLDRLLQGRERQALLLRYRDGCSIFEIATRMGITKRTVSRYLSEGLRKLQGRLAAE